MPIWEMNKLSRIKLVSLLIAALFISACSESEPPVEIESDGPPLIPVILQTDWYAQPEHAGFYQAQELGFYEEAGFDVTIRPGANMTNVPQMVATKRVQFAVGTSDNLLMAVSRGIPLAAVFPYFQHDPQCVMVHKESGITDLKQLDGKTVMIGPGTGYVQYMQKTLGIRLQIVPLDYSLTRFLANKAFIQQCFLTNEPFYAQKNGVNAHTIPLSTSGFDPYRLIYTNGDYAKDNPELVEKFVEATRRGWEDYANGDGAAAHAAIAALNSQHTDESMNWSKNAMTQHKLIAGDEEKGEFLGRFDRQRIERMISQLGELDMLDGTIDVDKAFPLGFAD